MLFRLREKNKQLMIYLASQLHRCIDWLIFFIIKVHAKQSTRKRYAEKLFKDGCMNHETGVAVALLAQYVRWILEAKMK